MNVSGIARTSRIGRLLRLPLRLIPKNSRLPVLQGPLRGYKWIAGSANHGCWIGSYEYEKQQLFAKTLAKGSVVYDVGANVGFYSLLASELVGNTGKVIAFEPLPRNVQLLREHVAINHLQNVQIIEAAVSDRRGEARFQEADSASMGRLGAEGEITVATVSLDSLVEEGNIPSPDYVKIDVEGAESLVLAGAENVLSHHHPTIFLAVHSEGVRKSCFAQLKRFGYRVEPIVSSSSEAGDEFLARPI